MEEQTGSEEMNFLEHLEEMRWSILRSLIAMVVGIIIAFIFWEWILKILTIPAQAIDPPMQLQAIKVNSMFTVLLEIGFFGGIVIALPYILFEIWKFVRPALNKKERRYLIPLIFFATCLFLIGITFAYKIILPLALKFFVGLAPTGMDGVIEQKIEPNISIDYYISFCIRLMVLFGIVFELPVISYFLGKIGLLSSKFMRTYRRHGIVIIFIIAAIVTPPDPATQVFLGIPLIILYELSVYIVQWVERSEAKQWEDDDEKALNNT